jgi:DNA mismatch endonuclease (patch repair protein)
MVDTLDQARRSKNMAAIRSQDMKPELAVRKTAHRLGFRYRLHRRDLPGKPDLVFSKYNAVIFVHGCFWHQHPKKDCLDGRAPKSNTHYWAPKLARNIERDAKNQEDLQTMGWRVLVIWECETKDLEALGHRIQQFLSPE